MGVIGGAIPSILYIIHHNPCLHLTLSIFKLTKDFHEWYSGSLVVKHAFGMPKTESSPPHYCWYPQIGTPCTIFSLRQDLFCSRFYPWPPTRFKTTQFPATHRYWSVKNKLVRKLISRGKTSSNNGPIDNWRRTNRKNRIRYQTII